VLVVPIPTFPVAVIRIASLPAVVKPIVSVATWNIPASVSPLHEKDGADIESAVLPKNWPTAVRDPATFTVPVKFAAEEIV
jgi:hypothetical protein